jgi:hypothetical protein
MSEAGDARAVAGWLRRFRWSLAGIGSPEREDIVAEVRAHLAERMAAGAGVTDALNAFGTPEAYARSFVEEMELARALTGERFPSLLAAVVQRAHRSVVAGAAFLAVLLLGATALGVVVTAVLRLSDPTHAGLWLGQGSFFFGKVDDPAAYRELLGGWIYPLAPLSVAFAWVLGRLALISALRTIRRSR